MARPEITGKKSHTTAQTTSGGKLTRGPPVEPACYSIATFCKAHHLSESMYFKLKNLGLGPREAHAGVRVLITFEAAADWRAEREAATQSSSASETDGQSPQPSV